MLRKPTAITAAVTFALLSSPAHAADWAPVERIAHYTVTGATGIDLYRSIGENGPEIGGAGLARRTIALTEYDLKWRRNYQPKGNACQLVSATPILTITYRLPKTKSQSALPPALAAQWNAFAAGIEAHERVHGAHIIDMTNAIIAATVGLSVDADPKCQTIRTRVLDLVKAEHARYKARARAFDAEEMADGGNVHRLVLGLVNG
jgi:predicted secreted Zn-dependent protease